MLLTFRIFKLIRPCLLLLLFAAPLQAKQTKMTYFHDRTTDFVKINPDDYNFHMIDASDYGESYFLNAFNRKGEYLSFLVSISNYNPFSKFAGTFDMQVFNDKGPQMIIHQEYKAKNTAMNQPGGKHKWGDNVLQIRPGVDHTLTIDCEDVDDRDIKGTVHMKIVAEPYMHDEKGLVFGDKDKEQRFWQVLVSGPELEVTADLTIDGKPMKFVGKGYVDHGWATEKVPTFSKRWSRLRVFKDGWAINLFQIIPDKNYGDKEAHTLSIHKDGKLLGAFSDWTYEARKMVKHEKSGYSYPAEMVFNMKNDVLEMTGTVKITKTIVALDVLGQLGWFTRKMVKIFYSNPWQIYQLADVDFVIKYKGQVIPIKDQGMVLAEFY